MMKKMCMIIKKAALLTVLLIFLGVGDGIPCTVAVVSGKATPDGRPLLWKTRDSEVVDNKILYLRGARYNFIGLVNAQDEKGENVWAGVNSEGFAIMNSASVDLAETPQSGSENGEFMRQALGECANMHDFEELLRRTDGKREVAANFGIIDAEGNACFFETGRSSYDKFDTADQKVAPFGYIVRTNYAFTSPRKFGGGGYIRFERISKIFQTAFAENRLDHRFILQEAARDLVNEKLHSYPLQNNPAFDPALPLYINTNDTINRNSTVSAAVFHGAPSREKAYLSTMWVILGQPVSSAAVPLWASVSNLPATVTGTNSGKAPLCELAKALVSYLYPDRRGRMSQYLSITRLKNYGGNGVLGRIFGLENQVFVKTKSKLTEWEMKKPTEKEMTDFETRMAAWIFESLKSLFPDLEVSGFDK